MKDDKAETVSEDSEDSEDVVTVKKITKVTLFLVKNWHIVAVIVSFLSAEIFAFYTDYREMNKIEAHYNKGAMDSNRIKASYSAIDSLKREVKILKNDCDDDSIIVNDLFQYKLPKGKWAK